MGGVLKWANPIDQVLCLEASTSLNWVETEERRTTQKTNVAELAQSDTFIKWHFHGSWEVIITPWFYCSDIPALFSPGLCHCFRSIACGLNYTRSEYIFNHISSSILIINPIIIFLWALKQQSFMSFFDHPSASVQVLFDRKKMDLFIFFTLPWYLTEQNTYSSTQLPHPVETIQLPSKAQCLFPYCLMWYSIWNVLQSRRTVGKLFNQCEIFWLPPG